MTATEINVTLDIDNEDDIEDHTNDDDLEEDVMDLYQAIDSEADIDPNHCDTLEYSDRGLLYDYAAPATTL